MVVLVLFEKQPREVCVVVCGVDRHTNGAQARRSLAGAMTAVGYIRGGGCFTTAGPLQIRIVMFKTALPVLTSSCPIFLPPSYSFENVENVRSHHGTHPHSQPTLL